MGPLPVTIENCASRKVSGLPAAIPSSVTVAEVESEK